MYDYCYSPFFALFAEIKMSLITVPLKGKPAYNEILDNMI